jgi:hypothetical protein
MLLRKNCARKNCASRVDVASGRLRPSSARIRQDARPQECTRRSAPCRQCLNRQPSADQPQPLAHADEAETAPWRPRYRRRIRRLNRRMTARSPLRPDNLTGGLRNLRMLHDVVSASWAIRNRHRLTSCGAPAACRAARTDVQRAARRTRDRDRSTPSQTHELELEWVELMSGLVEA